MCAVQRALHHPSMRNLSPDPKEIYTFRRIGVDNLLRTGVHRNAKRTEATKLYSLHQGRHSMRIIIQPKCSFTTGKMFLMVLVLAMLVMSLPAFAELGGDEAS